MASIWAPRSPVPGLPTAPRGILLPLLTARIRFPHRPRRSGQYCGEHDFRHGQERDSAARHFRRKRPFDHRIECYHRLDHRQGVGFAGGVRNNQRVRVYQCVDPCFGNLAYDQSHWPGCLFALPLQSHVARRPRELTQSGDFTFTTLASAGPQPLLLLHSDASEVSGVTNGSIVTPGVAPSGFTGKVRQQRRIGELRPGPSRQRSLFPELLQQREYRLLQVHRRGGGQHLQREPGTDHVLPEVPVQLCPTPDDGVGGTVCIRCPGRERPAPVQFSDPGGRRLSRIHIQHRRRQDSITGCSKARRMRSSATG